MKRLRFKEWNKVQPQRCAGIIGPIFDAGLLPISAPVPYLTCTALPILTALPLARSFRVAGVQPMAE
jgi:hypothetical protein